MKGREPRKPTKETRVRVRDPERESWSEDRRERVRLRESQTDGTGRVLERVGSTDTAGRGRVAVTNRGADRDQDGGDGRPS